MKKKRILFIISGIGLGNSTRTHAVISHLDPQKVTAHIATSGNGLKYFSQVAEVEAVTAIGSLRYGQANGKLSAGKTFFYLPLFLLTLLRNQITILRLCCRYKYSAVVIDSEYSVFFVKPFLRCPLVALNNADVVLDGFRKLGRVPGDLRTQWLIERLDGWFHRLVPQWVLSPSISSLPNTGKTLHFAPFVRKGFSFRPPSAPKKVVVMLSGSHFQMPLDFLLALEDFPGLTFEVIGRTGPSSERVSFLGPLFSNQTRLMDADILIINAGFSAVSEALSLRKPVVVVPIAHHAEQYMNARTVEELGLGVIATPENLSEKLAEILGNYEVYTRRHNEFASPLDGAGKAARFIEEHIL